MIKTYFINSTEALYDDAEFAWLQSLLLEEGIIGDSAGTLGLEVTESDTPAMTVKVSAGKALVEIEKDGRTFKVVVENTAEASVVIPSNTSGSNRVGAVIVRVDVDTEPNTLKSNIGTVEYIAGTGTSPLSDGDITTAVGSDGWYRLADVTVVDSETTILDGDIDDTRERVITNDAATIKDNYSTAVPTGMISPYAGRTAPGNFLLCDGSAVSRSTYAALLAVLCDPKTFTVTIASPAVFTSAGHGLVAGDKISFTTTGGLPSGLAANTIYYVISTGLTTDNFRVALSPTGAAVNTTGSQNGVHTLYISNFGKGDGSTTFNLPDLRSRSVFGKAATAPTTTLDWESSAISSNQVTVPDNFFPYQGQKVQLTTTGSLPSGLSTSTDYYIIRASATLISFASSQANANAGTVISISGGSGVHTMVYTNTAKTIVGQTIGEETHATSKGEMPAHTHTLHIENSNSTSSGNYLQGRTTDRAQIPTDSAGGDGQHNNTPAGIVLNYIIRI